MGRRGPAPKPLALKVVAGADLRPDRNNLNEPVPRALPPKCPPDATKAVREIWDYTVRELDAMGIAFAADRDTLRVYCEAVIAHRRACEMLAREPIVIDGYNGAGMRNPALIVQRDAAQTIKSFAQEFGLTPSARARVEVRDTAGDQENPFSGTG